MIDMTDDALEHFLAEDPGGPVVMLNLLRYVPGTGRADYLAYIAHTPTISGRYGTEPLYWGDGGTPLVADDGHSRSVATSSRCQRSVRLTGADPPG